MNTYGNKVRVTLFGQSHAPATGAALEGLPVGMKVDENALQAFLDTRRPSGEWSTGRREADRPQVLCGIRNGVLCGDTVAAVFENSDARPEDYRDLPLRPGHADLAARLRYGKALDLSGGGSFSGRMTLPLCWAGGLCLQYLETRGIRVESRVCSVGGETDPKKFEQIMARAREEGDSVGGEIFCEITGVPGGLGENLFGGAEARLSAMLFSIPAVKGVEFGDTEDFGSRNNDAIVLRDGMITCLTNHAGGILGGITTGMPVTFRVRMKPAPSIALEQRTVDPERMEETRLRLQGRHDACILPRAVPAVTAAAALVIADLERGG